eukprot:TRINITY_DN4695_c0_g1_i1.p7 TRINITY_DN4695_c0_g1~~TRINITY_DN4695_c0_g1_i1.p7  ORF type:complete len:122 (-),score=3.69 TRINITY_DN4695_c0_g1_i1:1168-1533(-)
MQFTQLRFIFQVLVTKMDGSFLGEKQIKNQKKKKKILQHLTVNTKQTKSNKFISNKLLINYISQNIKQINLNIIKQYYRMLRLIIRFMGVGDDSCFKNRNIASKKLIYIFFNIFSFLNCYQ